jgi:hypothetical protein
MDRIRLSKYLRLRQPNITAAKVEYGVIADTVCARTFEGSSGELSRMGLHCDRRVKETMTKGELSRRLRRRIVDEFYDEYRLMYMYMQQTSTAHLLAAIKLEWPKRTLELIESYDR